jgi:hypothetical protein
MNTKALTVLNECMSCLKQQTSDKITLKLKAECNILRGDVLWKMKQSVSGYICSVTRKGVFIKSWQPVNELVEPYLDGWSSLESVSAIEETDELQNMKLSVVKSLSRIYEYFCMSEPSLKWKSEYMKIARLKENSKVRLLS